MSYKDESEEKESKGSMLIGIALLVLVVAVVIAGLMFGIPSYSRYQSRQDAKNQVTINDITIQQTQQLVEVEKQKAQIRVQDAMGIAEAQRIINATLTPLYIQHEAIQAQEKMVSSPNHTEIYIPSGFNGVPLVPTVQINKDLPSRKDDGQ